MTFYGLKIKKLLALNNIIKKKPTTPNHEGEPLFDDKVTGL